MIQDEHEFVSWEASSRDTIDVKRTYIDMCGDLVAGVFLSQVVYYFLPEADGRGGMRRKSELLRREGLWWLPLPREAWWAECRIRIKQYDRCKQITEEEKSFLVFENHLYLNVRTPHIRINWPVFLEALNRQADAYSFTAGNATAHAEPGQEGPGQEGATSKRPKRPFASDPLANSHQGLFGKDETAFSKRTKRPFVHSTDVHSDVHTRQQQQQAAVAADAGDDPNFDSLPSPPLTPATPTGSDGIIASPLDPAPPPPEWTPALLEDLTLTAHALGTGCALGAIRKAVTANPAHVAHVVQEWPLRDQTNLRNPGGAFHTMIQDPDKWGEPPGRVAQRQEAASRATAEAKRRQAEAEFREQVAQARERERDIEDNRRLRQKEQGEVLRTLLAHSDRVRDAVRRFVYNVNRELATAVAKKGGIENMPPEGKQWRQYLDFVETALPLVLAEHQQLPALASSPVGTTGGAEEFARGAQTATAPVPREGSAPIRLTVDEQKVAPMAGIGEVLRNVVPKRQ